MKKIFTTTLMLLFVISAVFSQAGVLDPSFANDGILIWNVSGNHNNGHGIAVQPDGKIVITLTGGFPEDNDFDIGVVRLNEDGSVDSTFATNGIYHLDNPIGSDLVYHLELLDDGNIMVAGGYASEPYNQDFILIRLKSDGTPDPSFGENGIVIHSIGSEEDYARCITFDQNEKILVGGISYDPNPDVYAIRHVVSRFDMNGAIDTTFGDNGNFVWNNGGTYNETWSIAVTDDRNIVTSGKTAPNGNDRLCLYKILEDGSGFDSTFANNGELLATFGSIAYGMLLQSNGNILVTGPNYGANGASLIVLAYNQDGTVNSNFGQDGVFLLDTEVNDIGHDLVEQPDGKIIAVGESGNLFSNTPQAFFSTRMDANGILDTSWGETGYVRTETGWMAWASDAALQPDGKLVLTGVGAYDLNNLQVARYGNYIDADMDGYEMNEDCDDFVFAVNPGVEETPYNGIDDDCNELTPDDDLDEDGFPISEDCDDYNENINPDAEEIPDNEIDEDCDGMDLTTGIEETLLGQQLKVFPNPAHNYLQIEIKAADLIITSIEIRDITGRLVKFNNTKTDWINIESLPAGLWLLTIKTSRGNVIKRIIKA